MTITQLKPCEPPAAMHNAMQMLDIPLKVESLRIIIHNNQHYVSLESLAQMAISRTPEGMMHWLESYVAHHSHILPIGCVMQFSDCGKSQTAITLLGAIRLFSRSNAREFTRMHDLLLDMMVNLHSHAQGQPTTTTPPLAKSVETLSKPIKTSNQATE